MNTNRNSGARKRGFAIPVIVAGALSSVLLAFSMTPTFSALAASIQNTANTAGTGTLTMQEADSPGGTVQCNSTDGGSVSTNSATCATINKYGGNLSMVPGQTVTTAITIKDTGTVAASAFTLAGGPCTQTTPTGAGTANDLCAKIKLVVTSGVKPIFSGTAATFAAANLNMVTLLGAGPVAAGASVPLSFAVTLDATADNTYQGLRVSQPMTFTFGA